MQSDQLERYIPKALVYAILWSFAGDGKLKSEMERLYKSYNVCSNSYFVFVYQLATTWVNSFAA